MQYCSLDIGLVHQYLLLDNQSREISGHYIGVQVRDAKIKVLAGLPVTTKEEREDWEKLGETLKVSVFYTWLV